MGKAGLAASFGTNREDESELSHENRPWFPFPPKKLHHVEAKAWKMSSS